MKLYRKVSIGGGEYINVPPCFSKCWDAGEKCNSCERRDFPRSYDHIFNAEDFEILGKTHLWSYRYDSTAGGEESGLMAYAIRSDGEVEVLPFADSFVSPASDVQSYEEDEDSAPTIAESVTALGDVVGVIVHGFSSCSWEDEVDYDLSFSDNGQPELPNCENGQGYYAYIPVRPIDWRKVRRRLEDAIRKDEALMRRLASQAGIRVW